MPKVKPKLKDVLITEEAFDAIGDRILVTPVWAGVDRPDCSAYSCGSNRKLAERLKKAMLDGATFENIKVEEDIYGKSYVSYYMNIRMRCANADLKKLGY